jgi:hypothetical protein
MRTHAAWAVSVGRQARDIEVSAWRHVRNSDAWFRRGVAPDPAADEGLQERAQQSVMGHALPTAPRSRSRYFIRVGTFRCNPETAFGRGGGPTVPKHLVWVNRGRTLKV